MQGCAARELAARNHALPANKESAISGTGGTS